MTQADPRMAPDEINVSCRLPLLVLFISAAIWLVFASAFAVIASIKFHAPGFLADCSWLTYGRVHQAYLDSVLYGFCIQAGLGVTLWLFGRLGQATLSQRWLATLGASFWNLGVTIGIPGILGGDSTGFDSLEMPAYSALFLFIGFILVGISAALTFHRRRGGQLFASQWFLLAALFWFPWIFSTAVLLLVEFPVRGVTQAVIDWWYVNNLHSVWLSLVGLGTAFYFISKITNRELHNHYLALFTFWTLILFVSWAAVPQSAPVPAWMPTISLIASVLSILPLLSVALNLHYTLQGNYPAALNAHPSLRFIGFGIGAFIIAGLMKIFVGLITLQLQFQFTWFEPARIQLNFYGFYAMVLFGAVYYILPRLTGTEFPAPRLVSVHFWLASLGILLIVVPLAIGGIIQGLQLQNPNIPFLQIAQSALHFLRVSTLGDLLLLVAHLIFLGNTIGLAVRFYRNHALLLYSDVTADLYRTAEAKS